MPYVKPTKMKIGASAASRLLYQLEDAAIENFNLAAKAAAALRMEDDLDFHVRSLPQELYDFLDNFDSAAVQIAAKAFLDAHPHASDGDCGPFLLHSTCQICGVVRGDPCPRCGGGSFHSAECMQTRLVSEAAVAEETIPYDELEAHADKLRRRAALDKLVRAVSDFLEDVDEKRETIGFHCERGLRAAVAPFATKESR